MGLQTQVHLLATSRDGTVGSAKSSSGESLAGFMNQQVCDDLTAHPYDPDRPPANGWWHGDQNNINFTDALVACQSALANTDGAGSGRRVKMQLGRIYAGMASRKQGEDAQDAQRLMTRALDLWKEASDLGSGQASYLIALYFHAKDFPINGSYSRNFDMAWTYYKKSADQGNPYGLAKAARYLQYPDEFGNSPGKDPRKDYAQARAYLEQASKWDIPVTYYVLGNAMLDGLGYDSAKYKFGGVALMSVAYCKGYDGARNFFDTTTPEFKSMKPASCVR
jgi:hypothetical protein